MNRENMTTSTPDKYPNHNPKTPVAGDFSLRYLIEIFFRRKRVFLMLLVLTPVLAVLFSFFIRSQYISSTTILLGKEEILNPLLRYDTAVAMADTNRLGSFEKIIYSRPLLEETIRKLGLDKNLKNDYEMEQAVMNLHKNVHLLGLTSDSFQIACTASVPVKAKNLVATVSQLFIEKSLQGSRREAEVAVNLIEQQVDYYRKAMERTEGELQKFRQENIEILGQLTTLGGQLNEYRTKMMEAELELKQEQLSESLLSERLTREKPMVISQAFYLQNTPFNRQYQELQLKMCNLITVRDKTHPEVIKLQKEIDSIRRLMDEEKKKNMTSEMQGSLSPVYQDVSARLGDTHIKIKVLEQKISEYQSLQKETRRKLVTVPELEKKQAFMERDLKLTHELYDTLCVKLEQARITREVEIAQQANRFTIIEPPVAPFSRYKPRRMMFLVGGIAGGLCLGLLMIFLLEFTDSRVVRTGDLLKHTRLRLVGVLPKLYNYGEAEPFHLLVRFKHLFFRLLPERFTGRLKEAVLHPPGGFDLSVISPIGNRLRSLISAHRFVLPPDIPAGLAAYKSGPVRSKLIDTPEVASLDDYMERIHNIAIIARNAYEDPERLLWLVTSSRTGEGKTFLTANLGAVLAADLKKPVLLVDANFRDASLSKTLGYADAPGLADILEQRASIDAAVAALEAPGLYLLPAGTPSEDPDVLYNSPAFFSLMAELRGRFSFSLIEVPEILTSSGGLLLAPHADGIIFVVRLYSAKRKAVEASIMRLPSEKFIGVVFNYFEYWIPDWLYRWI